MVNGLPKIAYISDVPMAATSGGAVLLYRLFENYPAQNLLCVEGNLWPSQPEHRLPGATYASFRITRLERLLYSRFNETYSSFLMRTARGRAARVLDRVRQFKPDLVLTIPHRFTWLTAAEVARRLSLPLHLIVHDDFAHMAHVGPRTQAWLQKQFKGIYQGARSRVCISPAMRDLYRERYGADSDVILPNRAESTVAYPDPAPRVSETGRPITFAYAGTVNTPGYARLIQLLSDAIAQAGQKFVLYTKIDPATIDRLNLRRSHVEIRPFIPQAQVVQTLRRDVDVLYVPMSFDAVDAGNMKLGFPAKLTDCTATGLPMIIAGPAYCSAVRWARENPGVADVIDQEDPALLLACVQRLSSSVDHRVSLARGALSAGEKFFSYSAAFARLKAALTS